MTPKDVIKARLRITCPDKPGIVAAVTNFLHHHGVNITALDQHSTDKLGGVFFMRLEFFSENMEQIRESLESAFATVVGEPFEMDWQIDYTDRPKKTVIMTSRFEHCLMELLWRWSRGELDCDVTMVVSNHPDLKERVEPFGVPYHHVPVTKDTKDEAEQRIFDLVGEPDLIVLARYMQILSPAFVGRYSHRIINIHHSFLPAFIGADPYTQAKERGVKIIGATAHYVTEELDGGPIIEQDVARVTHRHSVDDFKDIGRDLERHVLARAVRWHLEDRIVIHDGRTMVFR